MENKILIYKRRKRNLASFLFCGKSPWIGGNMENEKMIVPFEVEGKSLMYQMPKELDHHVAQNLCKELDMLVDSYQVKELVMDFAKTEFMDSSGIGVIIGRSKTMSFRNGTVVAINLGSRVKMIFESAGLEKIVRVKGE